MMGIDEIGLFAKEAGAVKANADEVHKSMGNSLLTIREAGDRLRRQGKCAPPAPIFCISSPWEVLDKIMTLVRTSGSDPTRVGFHFATWEVNPKIRRDSPRIQAEYTRDPIAAERDFGAVPPFAKDPYHSRPEVIDAMIVNNLRPLFKQQTKHTISKRTRDRFVYAVPGGLRPDKSTPRMLILDAGETENSFAISMWSIVQLPSPRLDIENSTEDEDNVWEDEDEDILQLKKALGHRAASLVKGQEKKSGVSEYLQLDGCIEVQPYQTATGDNVKVHFKRLWELCIKPLLETFNIILVGSDRWNISQILNGVSDMGIDQRQYSLVWKDLEEFKDKVSSRELRFPPLEAPFATVFEDYHKAIRGRPVLHMCVQFKTVRRSGRKVVKPSGGTDDLYRTAALAFYFAFNPKAVCKTDGKTTYNELLKRRGLGGSGGGVIGVTMSRKGGKGPGSGNFSGTGGYLSRRSGRR